MDALLGEKSTNASIAIRALIIIGADAIGLDIGPLAPDIARLLQAPLPADVHRALIGAFQHAAAQAAAQPPQAALVSYALTNQQDTTTTQPDRDGVVVGLDGLGHADTSPTASPQLNDDPLADIGFEVDL